jgi:hypothetical protein
MSILAPSQPVRTWLEKLPAQHKPAVMALRTLIGAIAPDAHEVVYHDALCYSPTDAGFDPIVYVAAFRAHINLGFFYGGFFARPRGVAPRHGQAHAPPQDHVAAGVYESSVVTPA